MSLLWGVLLFTIAVLHSAAAQDFDVKGPLLPVKEDGTVFTTAEIITHFKHTPEVYTITSEDYQLTLFRVVPSKTPAPVVLLQHGFMCSSDCWVVDANASAFKLSDAGYDVWIPNLRGNCYSRSHKTLKPENKEFWDFSFHEMATKDLPAMIDFILEKSGQSKLHYVGHSMGGLTGLIMSSQKPEYNQKMTSLTCLAPTSFLSKVMEMLGPDGMAEEMGKKYMDQMKDAGKFEVFPRKDKWVSNETQISCFDIEENFRDMCVDKMESAQVVIGGPYLPAGQSFKCLKHLYQLGSSGKVQYYSYDTPEENKKAYGSDDPPLYSDKFKDITVPTVLWHAENDGILMDEDIDMLKELLPNVLADNRISDECFDHCTFMFPLKQSCFASRDKVYADLIEIMKKLDAK